MNDSNYTLRFPRSYQEATGKRLHRWEFQPPTPEHGDKIVAIGITAVAILLPLISWLFDIKLGG